MAMTFTTLTGAKSADGSIKSWMNYARVDAEGVLLEAQTMIYERLRVREMRTADTFPVRVGDDAIDVPDRMLEPVLMWDVTNDCEIEYREQSDLEQLRSWTAGVLDDGDPSFYAVFGEQLNFDATTQTAWTLRASYFVQPDDLSSSRKTNFLTTRYPHMLRMACLATGARFNHDDEVFQREQRLLFASIEEVNAADEMGRSTYSPVRM